MFSIGHSKHPIDKFLQLLKQHGVEALIDVRSVPYSRFSPQFSIHALRTSVAEAGCEYVFLGKELGGRPEGRAFYDDEGHVLYGRRVEAPEFLAGIERLAAEAGRRRVAVMCSEEDPETCHRRLLVARTLERRGIVVDHIRGDGRLQPESELAPKGGRQGALFGADDAAWKSKRPVRPARARADTPHANAPQAEVGKRPRRR
jgi:uncharacterized protein (DUF488 family)